MKVIQLNGMMDSDLNWSLPEPLDKEIFWQIDLGLPSNLQFPLENEMQFGALKLALKHFNYKPFQEQTRGLSFFHGELPLSERDRTIHYLELLADELHPDLDLFALIDPIPSDPLEVALLLEGEAWTRIQPIVKKAPFRTKYTWLDEGLVIDDWNGVTKGFCLPSSLRVNKEQLAPLRQTMVKIEEDYRILSETQIVSEWEGLDELYVQGDLMTHSLRRMLMGFCAAGGTVVRMTGEPIGLPNEISI